MASRWSQQVRHVQAGEPVSAEVTSRPSRALQRRTEHLKDRLDAIETGMSLVDFDAAISSDLIEGRAVYWNADLQRYEPALALMETDSTTGALVAAASADCLGVVLKKKSAKVADILLCGLAEIDEITNSVGEDAEPGRYYLSASSAGMLTKQKPPVSVPVCYLLGPKDSCSAAPLVLVLPQLRDFQQEHIHYRISLTCAPAGTHTPPVEGDKHEITDGDADLPGWLPADHEIFAGAAPTGAVFGYNISAHPALSRLWPPVPIGAVALLWDKGANHVGATEIPLGRDGLVIVNRYGIWWMSDCYGDVPWPVTYDSTSSISINSSESSIPECPRAETMRLDLVFVRMVLGAANAVVTDLSPAEGSPITVTNCDGDPASSGSLQLGLNIDAIIENDTDTGALALKTLTAGFKFRRGSVVSLIRAGSNVVISSSHTKVVDGVSYHYGDLVIDAIPNLDERELPTQITRLSDAVERQFRDVPYVGFAEDRDASVAFRFDVPVLGVPSEPKIKFRVALFGLATGTLPAMTMEYKVIERPGEAPSSIPSSWASPAPTFTTTETVTAYDVIEIESSEIDVLPGDTVIVQIARAASAGYAGEVALLRCKAILFGG